MCKQPTARSILQNNITKSVTGYHTWISQKRLNTCSWFALLASIDVSTSKSIKANGQVYYKVNIALKQMFEEIWALETCYLHFPLLLRVNSINTKDSWHLPYALIAWPGALLLVFSFIHLPSFQFSRRCNITKLIAILNTPSWCLL